MKKYFLCLLLFSALIGKGQSIPNAGFENWTSIGNYSKPTGWDCLNGITSSQSVYTCSQGSPGSPGSYYLDLTSKAVSGMGVVPGIAVSGSINQSSMQPQSGFAYNLRPAKLMGKWQYMSFGGSSGSIDIQLTRWDAGSQTRLPVATAHRVLSGMVMSWASFSISLVYVDSNLPDSCIITLAASGASPADNDYLYVDNLSFSGTVTGISTVPTESTFTVFPNPATNVICALSPSNTNGIADYEIMDISGKSIQEKVNCTPENLKAIPIDELPLGIYFLKVKQEKTIYFARFVKD